MIQVNKDKEDMLREYANEITKEDILQILNEGGKQ